MPPTSLIYIILLKLKGKAAAAIHKVRADTWQQVKQNLYKEFGENISIGAVIIQVETLRQGVYETFPKYKRRVLKIKRQIDYYENKCEKSCMIVSLRLHCIAGLQQLIERSRRR